MRNNWAEIGGVRLEGAPTGPSNFHEGFLLYTITNWRGLPSARGHQHPIPGAHGTYGNTEILRDERSMRLSGVATTASAASTSGILEELESALATRFVSLRVCDDTGVWSREVEAINFNPGTQWNRKRVQFTIDLIAPDPVRYTDLITLGPVGLPVREGGLRLPKRFPWNFGRSIRPVLQVENSGSVPTYPTVRVVGVGDSLTIMGGPRRIEFGPFSGEFVVDNLQRRAFLNGADVTRQLVRRDWQMVPAGQTYGFSFDAPGSTDAVMTVAYKIGVW